MICRCCFHCGLDKVKFSAPQELMCQSPVACVAIQNVCPEDKFFEMVHNNDPVFWTFLLLCAWINIQFVISHIIKGYVDYVGSWMYVFEFDLFTETFQLSSAAHTTLGSMIWHMSFWLLMSWCMFSQLSFAALIILWKWLIDLCFLTKSVCCHHCYLCVDEILFGLVWGYKS